MAIGVASSFKLYDELFQTGQTEVLQQATAFNAAANGAITLVTRGLTGEYEKRAFFDVISALDTRRDVTSVASVTDTDLTQDEEISVKLNRKLGPVAKTADSWRKIGSDSEELSFILGQQAGQAMNETMLNQSLKACEAALDNIAALEHDRTAGTMRTEDVIDGLFKFGDKVSRLRLIVAHSHVVRDLLKEQVATAIYRNEQAGISILAGSPVTFNVPVLMSDSPALIETNGVSSGVDAYSTLGLASSAIQITLSEEQETVFDLVSGLENIVYRWQHEYAFNLGLKGFKWDTANGGANPNDTALGTGTNWDKAVTADKNLAGVIIKSR